MNMKGKYQIVNVPRVITNHNIYIHNNFIDIVFFVGNNPSNFVLKFQLTELTSWLQKSVLLCPSLGLIVNIFYS